MRASCSSDHFQLSSACNHTRNLSDNFQELSIISYANYRCNYSELLCYKLLDAELWCAALLGTAHTATTKKVSPTQKHKLSSLVKKKEDGLCSCDGGLGLSLHCTGKTGSTHLLKNKKYSQEFSLFFFNYTWKRSVFRASEIISLSKTFFLAQNL